YGASWAFMPAIPNDGPHGAISPSLARDGRRPQRASPRSRSGSRSPMLPPAGGLGRLPAGRVTRGAGLARLAAALVHALTGGITGCPGMAGNRPPVLHPLTGCVVLRRALRIAERGRADQQPRHRGDNREFAHHG